MGLDVSHGCWSGGYSSFMHWRRGIAKCIGIPLQLMDGFFTWQNIDFDDIEKLQLPMNKDGSVAKWANDLTMACVGAPLPLDWKAFKPSPLHILLNHSDCEGDIPWRSCAKIADALEAVIPMLPVDESPRFGSWKDTTQAFVDGLRLAYKNKENVKFC